MKAAYAVALVAALALLSPAVSARQLKQDTSAITDADVLNFALNLEVSSKHLDTRTQRVRTSHSMSVTHDKVC